MSARNEIEAIRRLRSDPRLEQLGRYVPPLSLFRMFGMTRDELVHSRMLASLLDPRRHRHYERILRPLLEDVSLALAQAGSPAADIVYRVAEAHLSRVTVRRELFRIDIVVEVDSLAGELVLGIENKIDAGEQPDQLKRYQDALLREYPHHTAVMAFMCPTGREPTTASQASSVPCVALDYRTVLSAITAALDVTERISRDWRALKEIAQHIEEDILDNMDNMELRSLVGELWKDHGRALDIAMAQRPRLSDVQPKYESLLREHLDSDAEFTYYPNRGELREIKMRLGSWNERGVPLTFMFYWKEGGPPWVRVLLYENDYQRNARHLQSWAQRVNESTGPELDETFAPMRGEPAEWRRVLREEDHPQNAILEVRIAVAGTPRFRCGVHILPQPR